MLLDIEKEYKNIELEEILNKTLENNWYWITKRLSGNDTGITGGHQVGVYYPKFFFEKNFKEICTIKIKNPDTKIEKIYFPNDDCLSNSVRVIYYNNKFTENKTRNEFRLTSWGGKSAPIQQYENTGALFLFILFKQDDKHYGLAWVASNESEEKIIEDWIGTEVFPGDFLDKDNINTYDQKSIQKIERIIPKIWYKEFPSGYDIFSFVEKYLPWEKCKGNIDKLLQQRRTMEFTLFKHIELQYVQPIIDKGFDSVDDFIWQANSITNRRKSRTGKSLEHNLSSIFNSENILFDTQCITENRKKPDFLFPSGKAYHNKNYPANNLNMLGAKTCCKDRWRQILSEANRIEVKHLFTLQEGVSSQQMEEMSSSKVKLVVPKDNKKCFPEEWRKQILSLREFVDYRRKLDINICK